MGRVTLASPHADLGIELAAETITCGEDASTAAVRVLAPNRVVALANAVGSHAIRSGAADHVLEAFLTAAGAPGWVPESDMLRNAFQAANEAVLAQSAQLPASSLATSLLVVVFAPERALVAHLGNACCLRLRAGNWRALARVHSALTELRPDGDANGDSPFSTETRSLLPSALGLFTEAAPDISAHVLKAGDVLLLMSDPLRWCVSEPHIRQLFERDSTPAALVATVRGLARGRKASGAVAAVRVRGAFERGPGARGLP